MLQRVLTVLNVNSNSNYFLLLIFRYFDRLIGTLQIGFVLYCIECVCVSWLRTMRCVDDRVMHAVQCCFIMTHTKDWRFSLDLMMLHRDSNMDLNSR